MKKIVLGILLGCAFTSPCLAADILADIAAGVPGVKWGENLAKRSDMTWNAGKKCYVRTDESYSLPLANSASLPITKIWYYADAKGGFAYCILFADGASLEGLKSYVQQRYGEPRVAVGKHATIYAWASELVSLGKGFDGDAALTIKRPPQAPAATK